MKKMVHILAALSRRDKGCNQNGDNLDNINMIGLLADDLYIDDVTLSDSSLLNSYHLIPGASVGGYLGQYSSQPEDFGGMTDHYAWYYHSDDRGTTLATSDGSGAELHVFMPDSFGRYRYLQNGTLTDNVLLDSKAYFGHPDLYYFNARWYDYERGRWMSREPLGLDGPNLYHFVGNDPINYHDPDGFSKKQTKAPDVPGKNKGQYSQGQVKELIKQWQKWQQRVGPGKAAGTLCDCPDWFQEALNKANSKSAPGLPKGKGKGKGGGTNLLKVGVAGLFIEFFSAPATCYAAEPPPESDFYPYYPEGSDYEFIYGGPVNDWDRSWFDL